MNDGISGQRRGEATGPSVQAPPAADREKHVRGPGLPYRDDGTPPCGQWCWEYIGSGPAWRYKRSSRECGHEQSRNGWSWPKHLRDAARARRAERSL
jgi:hypothetical protein